MSATFTESDLANFYGTEQYYRHPLARKLVYTDGVHFLSANGAGWLVDAIASYQHEAKLNKGQLGEFQLWELKVKDNKGVLTCRADSNKKPVITQEFEYTDFPLAEVKLYVELGSVDGVNPVKVLMLASER